MAFQQAKFANLILNAKIFLKKVMFDANKVLTLHARRKTG
jgi:hypothetical protein